MTRACVIVAAAIATVLLVAGAASRASAQNADVIREARQRLTRGITRYEEAMGTSDPTARHRILDEALAEMQAAYALTPRPLVLFNLAQVHVELGEPVEAEDLLVRMLATADSSVSTARRAEAEALLVRARERIGDVDVATTVSGATVLVDGVERGTTPVVLRVAAGEHRVEARLDGYVVIGTTGRVAGGDVWRVRLDLVPEVSARARLAIRPPRLERVEVRVDGRAIGITPFRQQTIAVNPGRHVVEADRAGYLPFREELTLELGEDARVAPVLHVDADAPARARGRVRFRLPDAPARLSVDGEAVELREAGVEVPVGPHAIELDVSDREPWTGRVDVAAGQTVELVPELSWTGEGLRERQAAARDQGNVGIGLMLGGGVLLAGGIALLALSEGAWAGQQAELEAQLEGCTTVKCPEPDGPRAEDLQTEADDLGIKRGYASPVAVALLVGAATLAVVGAVLYFVLIPSDDEIEREASAPTLAISFGPGTISAMGRF